MKLCDRALFLLPCIALVLAVPLTAHAQISSATVYLGIPDPGNAADPANEGPTLQSAQFNIGSLGVNFQSNANYDLNSFLNNPTYFNLQNGFNPANEGITGSADNIELVLTGQAFLNSGSNSFVVGHDDGAVVTFGGGIGTVLNQPGPTGFTSSPFNVNDPGPSGLFSFTLDYTECCGPPADLLFTVNGTPLTTPSATPEPSSLALLGTGVLAFAGMVRRRFVA